MDMSIRTLAAHAAAVLAVSAFGLPAAAHEVSLSAHMMGMAEKPGPGDADGMGHATLKVNTDKSEVCWTLMVENIAPATMAHIHKGAADVAGGVALALTPPDAAGKATGCATADAAVVADIVANPAGYYVNVHNAEFRGGAIRGQLSK